MCGTKLSLLARNGPIWRFFCMQGEFYTVLATKKPSRESFVPNARQRSSEPTQQHTRPHRHGAEDTRGAAGPGRGAGCGRLVGPARVRRATARQISHAIPPRHGSMHTQKPRNINDQISIVEILLGELHAKLPRCSQVSTPYRDQAPQVWRAPGSGGSEGLAAVPVGGGAWPGFETTGRTRQQRPRPTGVEGVGGIGGPGCGARGRWRGLAGLRGDAPSEARGADGSRAGRRPRAHQAARPR